MSVMINELFSRIVKTVKNRNHDDNSYEQANPDAVFSMPELEEVYPVAGTSSTYEAGTYYYYVDDDKARIRYICLNTAGQKYIGSRQLKFLLAALMRSKPASRIIIFGHIWVEWDKAARKYFPNPKTGMLLNLFDAFNKRGRFGRYDFSACTSRVMVIVKTDAIRIVKIGRGCSRKITRRT